MIIRFLTTLILSDCSFTKYIPFGNFEIFVLAWLSIKLSSSGLSNDWRAASTQNIIIPIQGKIDAINISVAAGILFFEAKRQRNFL